MARLHYIPLSQTYKEIYNIHAYFSGPAQFMTEAMDGTQNVVRKTSPRELDGDKQLHRIARAGRQWKGTIGRKVDMESECLGGEYAWTDRDAAYVYRLCLEWARLWADDREGMSFKG